MVTDIDKVTHVFGIEPIECTFAGPIFTDPLLFLLLNSALKLDTPERLFSKWWIRLVMLLVITLANFNHLH